MLVPLLLILLSQADNLLEDLDVIAFVPRLVEDLLLVLVERLDLLLDALDSLDEGPQLVAGDPTRSA